MSTDLEKLNALLDVRIKINQAKIALLLGNREGALDILNSLVTNLNRLEDNLAEVDKLRKRKIKFLNLKS